MREGKKKKRRKRVRPDGTLSETETDYYTDFTDTEGDMSVSSAAPTTPPPPGTPNVKVSKIGPW